MKRLVSAQRIMLLYSSFCQMSDFFFYTQIAVRWFEGSAPVSQMLEWDAILISKLWNCCENSNPIKILTCILPDTYLITAFYASFCQSFYSGGALCCCDIKLHVKFIQIMFVFFPLLQPKMFILIKLKAYLLMFLSSKNSKTSFVSFNYQ